MNDTSIELGPFRLDQVIGRGGMGEIWRGIHVAQRIPVAVKVLTEQGARRDDYLRQFRNEIRSVAALDHPGIVLVFDHGEVTDAAAEASGGHLVAGSPYLVMELAQHGALDRYVHALNWPIVRHVVFNVLDALAHAHARGVVHRDLKPQNILLGCARKDGLGLKLADFGLAHPLDLTGRTGKFERGWGTPSYMAPEQFRGLFRDYGPYTDLYALGMVVWQLTTGELPFDGDDVIAISGRHLHGDLPAFEPRFDVPDGLVGWLHRLLQKDPRDRFPTAPDAAYALARIVGAHDDASAGRLLAGEHSQTVPIRMGEGETVPMPDFVSRDAADTIREVGATTELLPQEALLSHMDTTGITMNLAGWMDIPFGGASQAPLAEATQPSLAVVQSPPLPDDWRQPDVGEPSPQLLGAGLGLYGLRTVGMVDREDERDWLWEQLGEVHRLHEARLVVLEGRAGTGKSRLAQWLCERAAEVGGATILSAVHSPISGPADGVSGMLARHFGCVGLERGDVQERLARLMRAEGITEPYEWQALTELISPSGRDGADLDSHVRFTSSRQRFALLRRTVERIARERPVVLWLDDIQWGADALGIAEHLLDIQRATRSPILMVLTVREEALTERPLERSLLKRVLRADQSQLLRVEPLAAADTSELVRRLLMLEGDLAEQVEARSAGNPLFAVQLVDDWVSRGKLSVGRTGFRLRAGQTASIPDDIHQLWRERVDQLVAARSDYARVALELAAAFGQEVERDEWQRGCEFLGMSVEAELEDRLYASGLARPLPQGWRFVHGMLRESLIRLSREADRWQWLNAICADILEEFYPGVASKAERLAHYLIEAGKPRASIAPLLRAARFRAERSDFAAAHALLDRRGELLTDLDTPASHVAWGAGWVLRSEIFELEGSYASALTWAQMAVSNARDHGWDELLAPSLRAQGAAHLHMGDLGQAEAAFEEARQLSEQASRTWDFGLSLLGLGRVAQSHGQFGVAESLLAEAAQLLGETDDDHGLARCFNALGDIARQTRRVDDARRFAERARELFDAGGNQVGVADCLNDLSELHHLMGEIEVAEELCAQALHLYESVGSHQSMRVRLTLASILLHRGEFVEARRVLASAREHFERQDQLGELAHADLLLLACAAAERDWPIWDELFAEADRLCDETGLRAPRLARAATIAAAAAMDSGDADRGEQARRLGERYTGD